MEQHRIRFRKDRRTGGLSSCADHVQFATFRGGTIIWLLQRDHSDGERLIDGFFLHPERLSDAF